MSRQHFEGNRKAVPVPKPSARIFGWPTDLAVAMGKRIVVSHERQR